MSNKNKTSRFFGGHKNIVIAAVVLFGLLLLLTKLTDYTRTIRSITYAEFVKQVEQNNVKRVHVTGNDVHGLLADNTYFETVIPETPYNWDLLRTHNVDVSVGTSAGQANVWYLIIGALLIGVIVAVWFVIRQMRAAGSNGNNVFGVSKSKAKMFMPSTIKENFNSVAGAAEAKEELQDIVDFLKNPDKYTRLGAKITRGVLLVGEPGNGKTLLAKAVAGEANCPFFSVSGSDFIELFVGVGAARVRDLFAQARKYAPSIIFIDEIDAVGRQRGIGLSGGYDEREQTLNQLLSEMDGFQTPAGAVIVLAATNRPDVLDKALLRPGRFDRHVYVPYPDMHSREQILKVHCKSVVMDKEVDLLMLARRTAGFSGADLANLVNEAAINGSKHNRNAVTIVDFEEAFEKIVLGKERKTLVMSEKERAVTAYHEAGHTLVRILHPNDADQLYKVTIVPRGHALGLTSYLPERDRFMQTKEELAAFIAMACGGRAAEEITFGQITTGASDDFSKATELARKMVCHYGMSDQVGPVYYDNNSERYQCSGVTTRMIDQEVQRIVQEGMDKARTLLTEHKDKLEIIARGLLAKETLHSTEIYELIGMPYPQSQQPKPEQEPIMEKPQVQSA